MSDCIRCGENKETVTHHTQYDPERTVQLCHSCHGIVHSNPDSEWYPKDSRDGSTLRISDDTHERLQAHGSKGDTFDDIIRDLAGWDDE